MFAACGPSPEFESPCGLQVHGRIPEPDPIIWSLMRSDLEWDEEGLALAEAAALEAFAAGVTGDDRFENKFSMCRRLQGWRIFVHAEQAWVDRWGRRVSGLADCPYGIIEVGNMPPDRGALSHELAHAIQACRPNAAGDDPDHAGWGEHGIYSAVEKGRQ